MPRTVLPVLVLVAAMGLTACTKTIEDPAPVQTGSYLVYEVTEQMSSTSHRHTVRLDFTRDDDSIVVKITGPKGTASTTLDLAGEPKEGTFAVKLPHLGEAELGMLYLPAKDRRQGVNTKVGRTTRIRPYEGRDTWPVLERRGGQRFYDAQLGVLTGWQLTAANGEIVAKLVDSR